jgi:hypothetical protein
MPFRYSREYLKQVYRTMELGFTRPDPAQIRCGLLRSGLSIANSATLRDVAVGEVVPDNPTNGYTRQVFGQQITAVDVTGNTLTIPEHGRTANQEFFLFSTGSLPAPLAAVTPYYVISPTTNTLQLSATSGGAAIDITTAGAGTHFLKMSSTFDATDNREESIYDEDRFAAVTNDITFQGYFFVMDSAQLSTVTVTSINTTTEEVTCSAAHGLATGDPVLITVDSGGSQPGGSSGTTQYFARSTGTTTLTLHNTAADALANTNLLNFSSGGSGVIRIRNCKGILVGWDYFVSAQTIPAGQTQVIRIPTNILNTGTLTGV